MTVPPVLTLWRPQRGLLAARPSPLEGSTRRLVLSIPTSSGKTLMAQLLTVTHLSQTPSSGVCYVAPTRSLCREVRQTLSARVRVLQKEVGGDGPDFPLWGPAEGENLLDFVSRVFDGYAQEQVGDVDVMTPERLAHQLRHDASAVLAKFGMFIFDEAQLVQERGRGFTLESIIAFLNYATRTTDHRVVLLSAALGNSGQIMQWIDPDRTGLLHESDWRGPRRLHAMFSTRIDWDSITVTDSRSKRMPYRQSFAEYGVVALRPISGQTTRLQTTEPVGTRVLKATAADQRSGRSSDTERSTKNYVMAAAMITMLGHAGSVLIVANTRGSAERLARQLASGLPTRPEFVPLADFARQQLGAAHPLVSVLSHGVGYHHAGLPTEVLEALEEALRADNLPYLTCTSTLTEGVNLPVRTVVLYDEQHVEEARLTPGRLVNAMGRAGRAGKESEGWIVLLRPGQSDTNAINQLTPSSEDLQVRSTLVDGRALEEMAALEAAARENEDAVLSVAAGAAADFVSFVWMILAIGEDLDADPAAEDLEAILDSTLAAQQVSPQTRARWVSTADAVRRTYLRTDPAMRRRWAKTGTSLPTARVLDALADRVEQAVRGLPSAEADQLGQPHRALDLLASLNVLGTLLNVPENTTAWRFQVSRSRPEVAVAPEAALEGWIDGTSLTDLADHLLGIAGDAAWRISTLVDHVTAHFEHFLAWTVSALLESVNKALETDGRSTRLCPELGGYIRYGVNSPIALALAIAGLRSRRLLHAIASAAPHGSSLPEVREWLSALTLGDWRRVLDASPSEVLDLLDLTRARRGSLLRPLLETGTTSVPLREVRSASDQPTGLTLKPIEGNPAPAPLGLYAGGTLIAIIPPASHSDVSALLDVGLDISLSISADFDELVIALTSELSDT
ncbi:MAG TPA: DEAD/DEAH box helicase [Propionibacteriaceae bacterium]|nr:DEAD/DEAH box helicase [Propionibacteriaceae bacterium]